MKKFFYFFALSLLLLNSAGAFYGSLNLISDPSGSKLGMSTETLRFSPFTDFLLPGIVLLIVNGISSLVIFILSIKRPDNYTRYIILQGIILTGWIFIQVMMIRVFNPLHFIYGTAGILLIICGIIIKSLDARSLHFSKI